MSERALENVKFVWLLADLSEKVSQWETTMAAWPGAVSVAVALGKTLEAAEARLQQQAQAARQEQAAATQLKTQSQETDRLAGLVSRLERQTSLLRLLPPQGARFA